MTRRRGSHAVSGSIESLLSRLPERFWHPTPEVEEGQMTGLQSYLADLNSWLHQELSLPDAGVPMTRGAGAPPTLAVLQTLGIPPSEWYRVVLSDANQSNPARQPEVRFR